MSQELDERIVSMQFDNANFEKNISQTMQSLDDLDDQINDSVKNTGSGFSDVISGLDRLDAVWLGFYQRIGGYMADLGLKALNFGKSMSVDQVGEGFKKYTAETLSAQTIVSNAGEKIAKAYGLIDEAGKMDEPKVIEETYNALAKLQQYTDETSYSYADLSDTMSKFIMQGTDLYDAEKAMEGIGNWAAITGAGIQKASEVMPVLTKAVNKGYVSLQDWQSIQRSSMVNEDFVNRLLDNARKTNKELVKFEKKNGKITYQNFTDTENGVFGKRKFITSEALIETLKQYGDETTKLGQDAKAAAAEAKTFEEAIGAVKDAVSTGWGETFRYIFGDYAEARKFFTFVQDALLDIFTIGSEYRNKVLKIWHNAEEGGWKDMLQAMEDFWDGIKSLVKPIGDAFHEIFGLEDEAKSAQVLIDFIKSFRDFAKNFKEQYQEVQDIFEKIGSLAEGEELDKKLAEAFGDNRAYKTLVSIYNISKGVFSVIKGGISIIKGAIKVATDALNEVKRLVNPILDLAGAIGEFISNIHKAAEETDFVGRVFGAISDVIKTLLKPAIDIAKDAIEKLTGTIKNTDSYESAKKIFEDIAIAVETIAKYISDKLTKAFEWLRDAAGKINEKLKPLSDTFSKIKEDIGKLIGDVFSGSNEKKVGNFFDTFFGGLKKVADFLLEKGIIPAIETVVGFIGDLYEIAKPLGETIGDLVGAVIGLFQSGSSDEAKQTSNFFSGILGTIKQILEFVVNKGLIPAIDWLKDKIKKLSDETTPLGQKFKAARDAIDKFFTNLFGGDKAKAADNLLGFFGTLGEYLGKIGNWIINAVKGLWGALNDLFGGLENIKIKDLLDIFTTILSGRLIYNLGSLAGNLSDIAGSFSGFIGALLGFKESKSILLDIGKALLYLSGAVLILSSIDSKKLAEVTPVITEMITALAAAITVIQLASASYVSSYNTFAIISNKQTGVSAFASNIVDLSIGLLIIAEAIKVLSKIDVDKQRFDIAITAIESLIVIMAIYEKFTSGVSSKNSAGLIKLAIAVWLIGTTMKKLAKDVSPASLQSATDAIVLIIAAITAFSIAINMINKDSGKGVSLSPKVNLVMKTTILQLAALIGAIAGLIYVIGHEIKDYSGLNQAFNCVIALMAVTAALGLVVNKIDFKKDSIVLLYGLVGAIAALTAVVVALSFVDVDAAAKGMLVLMGAMIELAGLAVLADVISKGFNEFKTGVLGLYSLVGVMAALTAVMLALSYVDLAKAGAGLAIMAAAMVAFSLIVSAVGAPLGVLVNLFFRFAEAIVLIGAGALMLAESFKIISTAVSDTGKEIDDSVDENVEKLKKTVKKALSIIFSTLADFLGGIVDSVVKALVSLVKQVANSADEIVDAVVELLEKVVKALNKNSKRIGKALGDLLVALLNTLREFIKNALAGISDMFTTARNEGDKFARRADTIIAVIGSIAAAFFGLKTVASIISGISGATQTLTSALSLLSAHPVILVTTAVIGLVGAMTLLVDGYLNSVPVMSEEVQKFVDEVDAHTQKINEDYAAMQELQAKRDEYVNSGMSEIGYYEDLWTELQNIVDENGKVKEGYEDRATFITTELSKALGIEIDLTKGQIKDYKDLKKKIDDVVDAKKQELLLKASEEAYQEALKNRKNAEIDLAETEAKYSEQRKLLKESEMKLAEEQAKFDEMLRTEAIEGEGYYTAAEWQKASERVDAARYEVSELQKKADDLEETYNKQLDMVAKYSYDIEKYENNVVAAADGRTEDIISANWDAVKSYSEMSDEVKAKLDDATRKELESATKIGSDFLEGLKKGIKDSKKITEIVDISRGIGSSALKAVRKELGIKSPSKAMAEVGRFFDLGFADGISKYSGVVTDSSEGMANSVLDPMMEAIAMISDIDANALGEPVIRPVLDLSGIQNGMSGLGSMFGAYSVGTSFEGSLRSTPLSSGMNLTMNIYASEGQDVNQLAEIVSQRVNSIIMSRNNVWK